MPDFVHDRLVDPSRVLWQVQHGFSNTDFNGLTYQQVMADQSRAGMTIDDLWPPLSDVDDAQQFIADMIHTSGRLTMQRNIRLDPTRPKWARVCGPRPCAFCLMLASRGFAYNSKDTATFGSSFHDGHCHCTIIPSWGKDDILLKKQAQWESIQKQAAQAAKHADEGTGAKAIASRIRYEQGDKVSDGSPFAPDMRIPRDSEFAKQLGEHHVTQMNKKLKAAAQAHPDTVRLWARYAGEYRIHDPNYDDGENGAFFKQADTGISIKLSSIGKQDSISTQYQVMFHETSHMLDWLLNGRKTRQYSELAFVNSEYGKLDRALFTDFTALKSNVEKELNNKWRSQLKEIDEAEAYLAKHHSLPWGMILRMVSGGGIKIDVNQFLGGPVYLLYLLSTGLQNWRVAVENKEPTPADILKELGKKVHESVSMRGASDLDDMVQAWDSGYEAYAYAGHFEKDYWDSASRANEAFAEMMSAQIANPESWEHIQRFYPESAKMFENMVKEALGQ